MDLDHKGLREANRRAHARAASEDAAMAAGNRSRSAWAVGLRAAGATTEDQTSAASAAAQRLGHTNAQEETRRLRYLQKE